MQKTIASSKQPTVKRTTSTSTITPCLWFDGQAEEAAKFYVSLFQDSHIDKVVKAQADFPSGKKHDVLAVEFTLMGRKFSGLNGGPHFKFNQAVSFIIPCEDQAEVDRYWKNLSAVPGRTVRLGEGPLRPLLADCADDAVPASCRPGPRQGRARDGSHAQDEEARHRRARARGPCMRTEDRINLK